MADSLIPQTRIDRFLGHLSSVLSLQGDVAEAGVYKGGSAIQFAALLKRAGSSKELFLFDTFTGMPATDPVKDIHKQGNFNDVVLDHVRHEFKQYEFAHLVPGLFSDTLSTVADKKFCFVHIDCDIYSAIRECTEFFYPRMVPGGIIVYDDYCSPSCPGAKLAVDEFFVNKREKVPAEVSGAGSFDYALIVKE